MIQHTVSITSGEKVPCSPDQPLLDAALRQGVWLPNSCNQGTCGSCTVRVVEGSVDHRDSPHVTLSPTDRSQGMALACQATPCGDVLIEPAHGADGSSTVHPLRDFVGTVASVEDIAEQTRRLILLLDAPLAFTPGQYVELTVPGTADKRHYSIANMPGTDGTVNEIELHIKRDPGGAASDRWVFGSITPGEQVEISGPLGDFRCTDTESDGGVIMIAGGTGLAPILPILQTLLAARPEREVHLYQSARTEVELYARELLATLEARHPNLHVKPCLTRETWEGRTGYASEMIPEEFNTLRGWSGYLCGPPALVDAGRRAFKRRRMSPRQIQWEKYTSAIAQEVPVAV
ncbi:2Fe-2S iron-sulfur cluster binding domain-containing protein [Corynebacterium hylobatis]|uniref:2Fe-2S iron-sulfur cluster binding domain-containing protein n=1 Tax=Corynebacterium hylobatis TaxID=1859290 RepID=A0A3R9ZXZ8_9CORY|nr:2Fe-2S iron-sulfur cluster-binding protein [Corynebacterium hylobatis]RSZ61231.1 2Fe-2S iron-sulfur cluster binding domain-containing protein [Corynebacterium hylobatis]